MNSPAPAVRPVKKFDWFLWGMLGAVLLACIWPEPGARGGWLKPELLTKGGVALIFFLHGVSLSFAALRAGAMLWRLHLVVQVSCFLLFPLLGLGLMVGTRGWLTDDLRVGLFYLCALPSTVSSSVALTAAARGNVAAAVFNATLSSLLGVVLTPLWMGAVLGAKDSSFQLGPVILDLMIWLVLPLVIGQCLRPWLGDWARKYKSRISVVDRVTILVLVYTSFCDSVVLGIWTRHGVWPLAATLVLTLLLFYFMLGLTTAWAKMLKFPPGDRVAAVLCASKKSMATGIPMAQLMFDGRPGLGMILLPIMVYHPLQLIICGVLANRWAQESLQAEAKSAAASEM